MNLPSAARKLPGTEEAPQRMRWQFPQAPSFNFSGVHNCGRSYAAVPLGTDIGQQVCHVGVMAYGVEGGIYSAHVQGGDYSPSDASVGGSPVQHAINSDGKVGSGLVRTRCVALVTGSHMALYR